MKKSRNASRRVRAMRALETLAKQSFVGIDFSRPSDSTFSPKNGHFNVGKIDRTGRWVPGSFGHGVTLAAAIRRYVRKNQNDA